MSDQAEIWYRRYLEEKEAGDQARRELEELRRKYQALQGLRLEQNQAGETVTEVPEVNGSPQISRVSYQPRQTSSRSPKPNPNPNPILSIRNNSSHESNALSPLPSLSPHVIITPKLRQYADSRRALSRQGSRVGPLTQRRKIESTPLNIPRPGKDSSQEIEEPPVTTRIRFNFVRDNSQQSPPPVTTLSIPAASSPMELFSFGSPPVASADPSSSIITEFTYEQDEDEDFVPNVPLFEHFLVVGVPYDANPPALAPSTSKRRASLANALMDLTLTLTLMQSSTTPEPVPKASAPVDPEVLFKFPAEGDPPPGEIVHFCMPMDVSRGRVTSAVQDCAQRTGGCFIFQFSGSDTCDVSSDTRYIEEEGDVSRLFGICVCHSHRKPSGELTDQTCFAFISRFPLFEFFFQVIWDMLKIEGAENETLFFSRASMVPVLERLIETHVPKYGAILTFKVQPSLPIHTYVRARPPRGMSEQLWHASNWALPLVLSRVPIKVLVWAVSILLCETKLIVTGEEPGMVSAAVYALLTLLRPLRWVSPLIPIIPHKYPEVLESPVPIIGGMVTSDVENVLTKASDQGFVTAVLNVSRNDVCVAEHDVEQASYMLMPGAKAFSESLEKRFESVYPDPDTRTYQPSQEAIAKSDELCEAFVSKISSVLDATAEYIRTGPSGASVQQGSSAVSSPIASSQLQLIALSTEPLCNPTTSTTRKLFEKVGKTQMFEQYAYSRTRPTR